MKIWVVYETTYDHYQIMGIWYNEDEARVSMKLCEEEKNKNIVSTTLEYVMM